MPTTLWPLLVASLLCPACCLLAVVVVVVVAIVVVVVVVVRPLPLLASSLAFFSFRCLLTCFVVTPLLNVSVLKLMIKCSVIVFYSMFLHLSHQSWTDFLSTS